MRYVRAAVPLLLSLLLSAPFSYAAPATEKEKKELKIRWAFGAVRSASPAPRVEPVTMGMLLSSGDKLKMMIEIRNKCFVYVIHNNAQGEVSMLFPYALKQFETDYQPARKYYVPKGEAWFQLDGRTGRETFYLIASDQRLLDVEYMYEKYVSAESDRRRELAGQMLAELDNIRGQHLASSGQGEVLAKSQNIQRGFERATGADPYEIAGLATEIAFGSIYSEKFIIDHR
ncbi:MAG: DUF4384 domain-containing protein [Syntrophobacteraceae bacterium]